MIAQSLPVVTSLLLLLVLARLLGRLAHRCRQPPIIGEMLAGIILGPALFGWIAPDPRLLGISDLAVFLIVLSAGLEIEFKHVMEGLRGRGIALAGLAFGLPLVLGMAVGAAFGLDLMRTVFLGLCVSITALPVAVRILDSFGALDTNVARYAIATAILNDVAALMAVGVILTLPEQRTLGAITLSVIYAGGKLALLAAIILGFNLAIEQAQRRGVRVYLIPEKLTALFGPEALLGAVAIFVLFFASVSEMLGFHFIIGAFFGALLLGRHLFSNEQYTALEKTLASVTGGFLAPIFFASIGLEFSIVAMDSAAFVGVVLLTSILSKMAAGWLGGRLIGMTTNEALSLGVILNGRGVMELVIANIAYQRGFIDSSLFSTLVLMGMVTTFITPILFRRTFIPTAARRGGTTSPSVTAETS